jgi:hypothetical protein
MAETMETTAFERALIVADDETLRSRVAEWFAKGNRTPENALDIAPIVQSAMDSAFAVKIDEARRNWRNAEADSWNQARQAFDAAMCAFVEAMGSQPKPDPFPTRDPKWGGDRPAIGAGWGNQTA